MTFNILGGPLLWAKQQEKPDWGTWEENEIIFKVCLQSECVFKERMLLFYVWFISFMCSFNFMCTMLALGNADLNVDFFFLLLSGKNSESMLLKTYW